MVVKAHPGTGHLEAGGITPTSSSKRHAMRAALREPGQQPVSPCNRCKWRLCWGSWQERNVFLSIASRGIYRSNPTHIEQAKGITQPPEQLLRSVGRVARRARK